SAAIGTSRAALAALKRRGFQIHVSGLALDEFAVHCAPSSAGTGTPERGRRLRVRMALLSELSDGVVPIAPTHAPLVDKLGGYVLGIPAVPYAPWLERMQATW